MDLDEFKNSFPDMVEFINRGIKALETLAHLEDEISVAIDRAREGYDKSLDVDTLNWVNELIDW